MKLDFLKRIVLDGGGPGLVKLRAAMPLGVDCVWLR